MSIKDMELVARVSSRDEAVDVIAEIIKEELKNQELERKVASVNSAQVALFWFSNDYKTVSRVEDERYFDNYPEESNRGRICLNNGVVEIWVGQDCPDVMVEKVKFLFGINRIDDAPVKVYKDRSYDRFGLKDRIVAGKDLELKDKFDR
jgi:hypothetical protein